MRGLATADPKTVRFRRQPEMRVPPSDRFAGADMAHGSAGRSEPRRPSNPFSTGLRRRLRHRKGSSLSEPVSALSRHPAIDDTEQARRRREVDFVRGSVRYEGGILSDEIERLNARYIAGEINSDVLTAAILASDTARS